jgi:acetyl-CoA carboxylase biotin carboxylase subunit
MGKMFKKILIANRGEIAVRIIRACREMGVTPVAVYSDADRKALHVRLSEEAYHIGAAPPQESYLNMERILNVAKASGAEAIHPGYGFLAENAEFVRRCEQEGVAFIGPASEPMELMGQKTTARKTMKAAGIPIIPGTMDPVRDEAELRLKAREVGFPLLLKASAGGGGKGLRLVEKEKDLVSAYRLARSESQSSFGDSSVYIEKYMEEPHHIEVQVLADQNGHTVYLGERECSVQRRFQKILEETPSPFLDNTLRGEMGEVAVQAAAAVGYQNAGTVEFIVDKHKKFYFLEMNARLQVEHPVTEMVTGIDLVKCQLEIASGNPLPFSQADIRPQGHSLECRIYAEDPYNGFMPSPGRIERLRAPAGGPGVRYDNGIYEGYEVPLDYDPLLSKLITWGNTREEAIHRMLRALSEYQVYGIKTIIPFFQRILLHPSFYEGIYNTHFIEELEKEEERVDPEEKTVALIAAGIRSYQESRQAFSAFPKKAQSNWKIKGRMEAFSRRI